ncbi:MAG: L,D-transpeptidase family protein [Clostridiaceae bacterium]
MLKRIKLSAIIFMAVLFVLSVTQILIDTWAGGISANIGSDEDSHRTKKVYSIFIEIEDKTLYLLENGRCIKEYTIASGKSGYPSPLGRWTIVEKGDWGEGFGGRWLGLDVPWGIYGIHGTIFNESIGSAASKGCIRMFSDDVAELYGLVTIGTEVTIVNGQFGPFGRGFDEINPGDRGADVLAIQQRLKQLGYYDGELDGIYEDSLKKAVHSFQRANKLKAQNTITRETWLKMGFREFE